MRRFLLATLVSCLLLAATASTALMAAIPTVGASCSADKGQITVSFIYDASQSPPPITTVQVDSTDSQPHVVGITFLDLNTGAVITNLSGSVSHGTNAFDVTAFNQHMVSITSPKWGTFWAFPYIVACSG